MPFLFLALSFSLNLNNKVIFDFNKNCALNKWIVVNDDVMGGKSNGKLILNKTGNAMFKGEVSLENNGGFSSIRYKMKKTTTPKKSYISMKIRGDGKRYQLRIKEKSNDYYSYVKYFQTSNVWEEIKIPINSMYPSFRGRKLDKENFNKTSIEEIGFLIGNKKQEKFNLEIDKIELSSK